MLTQQAFHEQNTTPLCLHFATLTRYDASFKGVDVLFEKDDLQQTLGEVLSDNGLRQVRIAETEKYPHVTFFFSGGRELPFPGEERILRPSPSVATDDLQPEMSAPDLRDALIPVLQKGDVDFVCLNFANPDMVGHTGSLPAAAKAVEAIDLCMSRLIPVARKQGYEIVVIADHGNSDCMINPDGSPHTAHTLAPVPVLVIRQGAKTPPQSGILADVAPTLLALMGLEKPQEMTGTSLV
jgi:2,3-bisphosphoglycerate-independent phosphoglycerate mutase